MLLTEKTLYDIAIQARVGLRECLQMIALHGGRRENAFLNPPIVLTAVSTWERFLVDVALASEDPNWSLEITGWDRHYDSSVPWPGSSADGKENQSRKHEHQVDAVLARNGVLPEQSSLTASWRLHVPTSWKGAYPQNWIWAEYPAHPLDEDSESCDRARQARDLIRSRMLGAKSARDAAGHRLLYKKAQEAQGFSQKDWKAGYRPGDLSEDVLDQRTWCYVWQSDNTKTAKSSKQTPTIQHGYARGVVALFIQLIDITIATIRDYQQWDTWDAQLPSAWFETTMPSGHPCSGTSLWNGRALWR